MATPYQPLFRETPKQNPIISCKILTFVITFVVALFSVVFLVAPYQFELEHSKISSLPAPQLCESAQDSQLCLSYVSELVSNGIVTSDSHGVAVLQKFLVKYVHHMNSAIPVVHKIRNQINDISQKGALADCLELLDLSIDLVTDSIAALGKTRSHLAHANAQVWLSGVLTNHVTCLDGLDSLSNTASTGTILEELISRAKTALAILASVTTDPNEEVFRPLLGKIPWVSSSDRKLLESSAKDIKANAVVAQDGSGDYQTLTEAVAAAPDKSKNRYVIYVKKGTYKENVEVTKKKMNLMIVGDGMNSTIITGSLNVVDGSTTFRSATLGKSSVYQTTYSFFLIWSN
uniref:Pectinesterase n=1 Tax=Nicotiana tabacum TaxID=4097 RepID=A0A1S4A137_TOBAC|nr:PREDICTED: pectinesterase 2.1-like [Nicotiana tabacum]